MTLILDPKKHPILRPKFRPIQTARKRTFWCPNFKPIFDPNPARHTNPLLNAIKWPILRPKATPPDDLISFRAS